MRIKPNEVVRLKKLTPHSWRNWPSLSQFLGMCGVVTQMHSGDAPNVTVRFDTFPPTDKGVEWNVSKEEIEVVKFEVGDRVLFRANPTDNPEIATVTSVHDYTHSSMRLSVIFDEEHPTLGKVFKEVPTDFFRPLVLNKVENGKKD